MKETYYQITTVDLEDYEEYETYDADDYEDALEQFNFYKREIIGNDPNDTKRVRFKAVYLRRFDVDYESNEEKRTDLNAYEDPDLF